MDQTRNLDTGLIVLATRNKARFAREYSIINTHHILKRKDEVYKLYDKASLICLGNEAIKRDTNVMPYAKAHPNSHLFPKGSHPQMPLFPAVDRKLAPRIDFASPLQTVTHLSEPHTIPGPKYNNNSCYLDSVWWICLNLRLGHLHVDQMTEANQDALEAFPAIFWEILLFEDMGQSTDRGALSASRAILRKFLDDKKAIENGKMANVALCFEMLTKGFPQVTWSTGRAELCGNTVIASSYNQYTWNSLLTMNKEDAVIIRKDGLLAGLRHATKRVFQKVRTTQTTQKQHACEHEKDAGHKHEYLSLVWDRMPPTLFVAPPTKDELAGQPLYLQEFSLEDFKDELRIDCNVVRNGSVATQTVFYELVGISRFAEHHYTTLWKGMHDGKATIYFWDDMSKRRIPSQEDWYTAAKVSGPGKGQIGALVYRQKFMRDAGSQQ